MAEAHNEEEREQLARFRRYLDDQGSFDEYDVRGLRQIASGGRFPLTLEGWERIAEQLREQDEGDLADEIFPISSLEVIFEEVLTSLTASSTLNAEWAVFIGAGGSKPEPTSLPLVTELLPTLWKKATEINAKHLLELQELCRNLEIENIEELLTAIDITRSTVEISRVRALVERLLLGSPSEPRSMRLRASRRGLQDSGLAERLQESMQTLFSLLVGMMRMALPNDFHKALARRAHGPDQLSIMTTNYDVCVERSLGDSYRYGGIEDESQDLTTVLKLHGSLNWFSCSSCDEVVTARLEDIENLTRTRLFPVVLQCPECDATAPHLIVPPVGNKVAEHPVILQVRQQAEKALRQADVVIFVGYSFSEADEYVLRMVSRAVTESHTRIIVFDLDKKAVDRLKSYLTAHARGYDVNENVAFIRGDAAETFPRLVDAWEGESAGQRPADTSIDGAVG